MKLAQIMPLFCDIGNEATRILHKKIGKVKGLDEIERQIREEATQSAEKSFGGKLDRVATTHIDRFVNDRMKYMKKAFTKLDNPKTDTSKVRGEHIGDTETRNARQFGKTKGIERLGKSRKQVLFKAWINDEDSCDICEANADEGPIPIDEEFSSGDYAPQAHVNCTCYLEYTDEDGKEVDVDNDEVEEE